MSELEQISQAVEQLKSFSTLPWHEFPGRFDILDINWQWSLSGQVADNDRLASIVKHDSSAVSISLGSGRIKPLRLSIFRNDRPTEVVGLYETHHQNLVYLELNGRSGKLESKKINTFQQGEDQLDLSTFHAMLSAGNNLVVAINSGGITVFPKSVLDNEYIREVVGLKPESAREEIKFDFHSQY